MKGARRGGTPVTLAAGDRCPCSPSRRGRRDAACRGCTEGRDRRILNSWSALHCGGPGCRFRSSSGRHGSWRSLTAGGTGRMMARSQRRWLIRRGGACGFRSSGLSVFAQRLKPNFVDQQEMCTVKEPPQRSEASVFPELLRFAAFHCVGFRGYPTSEWCAHFPPPPGALIPRARSMPPETDGRRSARSRIRAFRLSRYRGPGAALPEPPIAASLFPRRCLRNVRRSGPPHW